LLFSAWGGGYIQAQIPVGIYMTSYGSKTAMTIDAKMQTELGPPIGFFPGAVLNIGAIVINHDWISQSDNCIVSYLYGGMFRLRVAHQDDATVELKAQKSFAGDDIFRFSCGFRLFFSKHLGFHLHGDNFTLWRDHKIFRQGGFFLGLAIKL
jgi:hypothetical protein